MANELWYHAIKVLDTFRQSSETDDLLKLFDFDDKTKILEKLKKAPHFKGEKKLDVKVLFSELIKLLLETEERERPTGYKETRNIDTIKGFQELSNTFQLRSLEKHAKLIEDLRGKHAAIEKNVKEVETAQAEHEKKTNTLKTHVNKNNSKVIELDEDIKNVNKKLTDICKDVETRDSNIQIKLNNTIEKFKNENVDNLANEVEKFKKKEADLEQMMKQINIANITERLAKLEENEKSYKNDMKKMKTEQEELISNVKGYSSELEALKDEQTNFDKKANAVDKIISDIRKYFDKLKEEMTANSKKVDDVKEFGSKLQTVENALKKEITNVNDKMDQVKAETDNDIIGIKGELSDMLTKINEHNVKIEDANKRIKRHAEQFVEIENNGVEYNIPEMKAKIEDIVKEAKENSRKIDTVEKKSQETLKLQVEEFSVNVALKIKDKEEFEAEMKNQLKEGMAKMEAEIAHLNTKSNAKDKKINQLENKCSNVANEVESLNHNLEKISKEKDRLNKEMKNIPKDLDAKIKTMIEKVEKEVKKNSNHFESLIEQGKKLDSIENDLLEKIKASNDSISKNSDEIEKLKSFEKGIGDINEKVDEIGGNVKLNEDEIKKLISRSKDSIETINAFEVKLKPIFNLKNDVDNLKSNAENGKKELYERIKKLEKNHEKDHSKLKEDWKNTALMVTQKQDKFGKIIVYYRKHGNVFFLLHCF